MVDAKTKRLLAKQLTLQIPNALADVKFATELGMPRRKSIVGFATDGRRTSVNEKMLTPQVKGRIADFMKRTQMKLTKLRR